MAWNWLIQLLSGRTGDGACTLLASPEDSDPRISSAPLWRWMRLCRRSGGRLDSRPDGASWAPVAGQQRSRVWDGNGGRHCPSYVKGWDPAGRRWVERIYYAGAADNLWGPYTIGFLEWDGERWIDQPEPAFTANQDWEHGSVYEPNLIYHEGKWKMWYVAGSNHEDYLIHGYAESDDGATGWSKHAVFAAPDMKMFDFCVRQRGSRFDAVFARVWVGSGVPPDETGLWWCSAEVPRGHLPNGVRPLRS